MSLPELFFISVGLSADAFAVALCFGLASLTATIKEALIVGLYFGFFQAFMPLLGYLLGTQFASKIIKYDHWVAFFLLSFIGGSMIVESFKNKGCSDRICPTVKCSDRECPEEKCTDRECPLVECSDRTCPNGGPFQREESSLSPKQMLPLAIATSIDALAAGVTFAFLQVNIIFTIIFIGITTSTLSMIGVKIGNLFGLRYKSKAEFTGGIILFLIGLKILMEHTGVINF